MINVMKKNITKKQKEVFDYIKDYIQENEISPSQKEIKDHFNFKSFGSVQRYLKYLVDSGYIKNQWNERRGLQLVGSEPVEEETPANEIPLIGRVAAGNPVLALENPDEFVTVPDHMTSGNHRYFALTVTGLSMIDEGILEEDIIVCRQQQEAREGQIVVAVIEGEATVKKYFRKPNAIELHPANKDMHPIIVDHNNFYIAGVVVGLLRDYGV